MQDRRKAGHEGCNFRRDAGQEGCRKVGILDRWDAGCGMQERWDAGQEGCCRIIGIQDRLFEGNWDSG